MDGVRSSEKTNHILELVKHLLAMPRETEWLEDKQSNSDPEKIGEYLSALSNAAALAGVERGYMIWGIRDSDREVVGTSFKPKLKKVGNEDLIPWLTRLLTPEVYFEFHEVEFDGKPLVLLEVARALHQPTAFRYEAYIRIGSYKKKLREHVEFTRRLWDSFRGTYFEEEVAASRLDGPSVLAFLDYPSYFDLMGLPLPENREGILEILQTEGMIKPAGAGLWDITSLGGVLFAKQLDEFALLRRKAVRVIHYRDSSRIETIKEFVLEGGYASGFGTLISYINNSLPSNEVIGQALRRTLRMYPDLAIRELVANALIHQDFSLTGTGPMVEIFADRIEITNPGVPLVKPERFLDSPPLSRNEKLAAVMRRIGVCEERGSGWDKIVFEVELFQLPAPQIEVTSQHTRVTLFSHRDLKDMTRDDRIRAVYWHACLRYVIHQKVNNTSIRERFGIDVKNSATASRLIKEATDAGVIALRDPSASRKFMEYVPWWAAPRAGQPSV
ncbi:ATP-binding protein [Nonomuraea rubra]